jgi:DNA repair protein RadA
MSYGAFHDLWQQPLQVSVKDMENTFRAERVFQIVEHRGIYAPDEILRKIYVCKIYNTSHLEVIIQELGNSIEEYRA